MTNVTPITESCIERAQVASSSKTSDNAKVETILYFKTACEAVFWVFHWLCSLRSRASVRIQQAFGVYMLRPSISKYCIFDRRVYVILMRNK